MANKKVSGTLFKKMVTNGAINLKNNHKEIDHLNVFPVPDGDTGTNMQMTMMAGIKEVSKNDSESIVDISQILSRGLLMGARGNSGVILSQFFRGVYSEISKIENGSATIEEFIQSLVSGYQMAYRAVMDPVEGTILTVARESAEKLVLEAPNLNSVEEALQVYLEQAKETLEKTPELLPVLKEAGVVDSGGAGFIKIIEGMIMALEGHELAEIGHEMIQPQSEYLGAHNLGDVDIKYGYCTEFIVELFEPDLFKESYMKDPLMQMGDSLVLVKDEELLKIHIHTNQPGIALTLAQKYGDLKTIKIDNMREQHGSIMGHDSHDHLIEVTEEKPKQKSKYAIIAVASGSGIKEAFKDLGVDYIIDGGQTMNPSTEDFVKAIDMVNADHIILLPNNSNIILAAEQVVELMPEYSMRVVKSKSIAQGYASLITFDQTIDIDENVEVMMEAIGEMNSGEVTYSIRDTEINGLEIKEGDHIGIFKGEIVSTSKDRVESTKELLEKMIDEDKEIVTIFYGKGVSEAELEEITAFVNEIDPDMELEFVDGQQDIYSYIIAVE